MALFNMNKCDIIAGSIFPQSLTGTRPMANTKQAAKRARQTNKQRAANMSLRTTFRTAIKKVLKVVAGGDAKAAQTALASETSAIDRAAGRGLIHRNKAARHKSRLAARVKALAKQA